MQSAGQARQGTDLLTIAQFIVSGLGLISTLVAVGLLTMFGLAALLGESLDLASIASIFSTAWVCGLVAALILPSLVYSFQRLQGAQSRPLQEGRLRLATILLLVWPLALVLGNLISAQGTLTWLLLPPLQLLAVGLPIWWLVELARQGLPAGSRQREWGVVTFSLLVTTPLIILAEIIVLGFLLILFMIWVSNQPELVSRLEILSQRILTSQLDPESILQLARPYLQNPLAIFSILALLAGIVPLLEELLKSLALWPLAGRQLSPAEGFATGAVCGGTFALLESLLSLTGPLQDGWAMLALGRTATGLLHITTTALIGWALVTAWNSGSYMRLGLAYLIAVGLHGLWNGLTVLAGLGILLEDAPGNIHMLTGLSQAAPFALAFLVLTLFLLLRGGNRLLRETKIQPLPASSGLAEMDPNRSSTLPEGTHEHSPAE